MPPEILELIGNVIFFAIGLFIGRYFETVRWQNNAYEATYLNSQNKLYKVYRICNPSHSKEKIC